MSEPKMNEKKVVSRSVVIALGIICILLTVGLVLAISAYTSTVHERDDRIGTLNSLLASKDSEISGLNTDKTNLQNQIDNLSGIVHLTKSQIWDNRTIDIPASYHWSFSSGQVSYAGYVAVWVDTSATASAYVRGIYSTYATTAITDHFYNVTEVNYDNQINVGTHGTAVFPVLPTSNVEIRVGNTNLVGEATVAVTITYYY